MNRRAFLGLSSLTIASIAGCVSQSPPEGTLIVSNQSNSIRAVDVRVSSRDGAEKLDTTIELNPTTDSRFTVEGEQLVVQLETNGREFSEDWNPVEMIQMRVQIFEDHFRVQGTVE
ncbi:hypothetical protein GCM10009039_21850 [Halocalculus aciditolerans]|uniref:Uncharacterized protein n=1 Tax=Halocalculus aciditolerans TaxID=1383812 RepID=A0A830FK25_9EURY|nr:hypothetical protein GCM10009039_21850 [Halocalculus aciditolerans]